MAGGGGSGLLLSRCTGSEQMLQPRSAQLARPPEAEQLDGERIGDCETATLAAGHEQATGRDWAGVPLLAGR